MQNKYKRKIDLRKHFKHLVLCKDMFTSSVERKEVGKAIYWANSIKFWRNEIKGVQNAN